MGLPTGFAHYPATDRDDVAAPFGNRYEASGRKQAALRVTPADERLRTHDRPGLEIHFGLVVQYELILLQSVSEAGLMRLSLKCTYIHFSLKELIVIATAIL